MIVRLLGEGQYDVPDSALPQLNELDAQVEATVASGDEELFRQNLLALHAAVQQTGALVPDDSLLESDLVLPPSDATIEEIRALLDDNEAGDGLIPG